QPPEVELAPARDPRLALVVDRGPAEADPAEQSLHEAMALAQLPQRRQRARRQQSEVTGVGGDRRPRQPLHHAIEGVRGGPLQPGLALAPAARAVDVVVALAPLVHEPRDQLRRILAV